jgi:hypothetical protein
MSYDDPEEELLDQHLREAFSEFELPPARHVWPSIEGQLGALPGTSPLLSFKLLLPAIAVVGVAAGWLLPRPAPTIPAATTLIARKLPVQAPLLAPVVGPEASAAPVEASAASTTSVVVGTRQPVAVPNQPVRRPAAVAPLVPQPPTLATASAVTAASFAGPDADSSISNTLSVHPSAPATEAAQVALVPGTARASAASGAPKAVVHQEFHAEFRQPTHRRAEKGRGIRRHLSAVGQWVQQLVSPRRARTTGHPSF